MLSCDSCGSLVFPFVIGLLIHRRTSIQNNNQIRTEYTMSDKWGISLFSVFVLEGLLSITYSNRYETCSVIPERWPDKQTGWEDGGVGGATVGSLYISFVGDSGRAACYSLECLESVPFPLQSVSFCHGGGDVFARRPEVKRRALWPSESRPLPAV